MGRAFSLPLHNYDRAIFPRPDDVDRRNDVVNSRSQQSPVVRHQYYHSYSDGGGILLIPDTLVSRNQQLIAGCLRQANQPVIREAIPSFLYCGMNRMSNQMPPQCPRSRMVKQNEHKPLLRRRATLAPRVLERPPRAPGPFHTIRQTPSAYIRRPGCRTGHRAPGGCF